MKGEISFVIHYSRFDPIYFWRMTFDEYIESTKVAQTREGMIRKAA
ncbi:MAG: hypothetical protein QNK40_04740 [Desulfobacterales bacterium]|nr:hypothetical protein [Desulfobacterales bacterium]